MVEFYGKSYYIDLDGITDKCRTGKTVKDEDDEETLEINIFKYEVIKMCLDRVLGEFSESESEIDAFLSKDNNISFNIAFKTLIKNKILIEDLNEEDE